MPTPATPHHTPSRPPRDLNALFADLPTETRAAVEAAIPTGAPLAEAALAGAALLDAPATMREVLPPLTLADFTDPGARITWAWAADRAAAGLPVDILLAAAALRDRVPVAVLESFVDACPTVAHAGYYAVEIREAGKRRALASLADRVKAIASRPDTAPDLLREEIAAAVETDRTANAGTATNKTYAIRSWGDIRDLVLPPLIYFLGHCMALGRLIVLFGQGGLGKSRVALNIARNQVLGLPFANLPTGDKPLRHLFMGSENSIHRLQDDIRRMDHGLTPDQSALLADHIFLATLEGPTDSNINLGDPENVNRWRDTIRQHRPDVLWVDPWGDVQIGDAISDTDTRATVSELLRLARIHRQDAAVIVLAHARTGIKNIEQATGYDAANFGKNSKALFSSARCVFNLAPGSEEENPPLLMVHAKSNDGPRVPPFALQLNPDTHLYEIDTTFDLEAWRNELNDRANSRRRPAKAIASGGTDKAFERIASHGTATKTEAKALLREIGLTRDQSDDALRQLLHTGKLVSWTPAGKSMPTFVGTPEAIESKRRIGGVL